MTENEDKKYSELETYKIHYVSKIRVNLENIWYINDDDKVDEYVENIVSLISQLPEYVKKCKQAKILVDKFTKEYQEEQNKILQKNLLRLKLQKNGYK